MVRFTGGASNRISTELAHWEQIKGYFASPSGPGFTIRGRGHLTDRDIPARAGERKAAQEKASALFDTPFPGGPRPLGC